MIQAGGLYTVGGLMMMVFLAACAAAGTRTTEGPTPSIYDRLAPATVPATDRDRHRSNDSIPVAE